LAALTLQRASPAMIMRVERETLKYHSVMPGQ
jgi:hypothetical protein